MILFEIATIIALVIVIMGVSTKGRVFSYLANRISSKANNLAEGIRDPRIENQAVIAGVEKNIRDMESVRVKLREQRNQTARKEADTRHRIENYEKAARLAGQAQKGDDVRIALTEKTKLEQLLVVHTDQLKEQEAYIKELSGKIEHATAELDKAKSKNGVLMAKMDFAEIRKSSREAVDKFGNPTGGLERLNLDVAATEDHLKALDEEDKEKNAHSDVLSRYSEESAAISDADIAKYMQPASNQ
jgi:phage shock protein A